MVLTQDTPRNRRRNFSDSSSDALRTGGPGIIGLIVNGVQRSSPGAIFVATVCITLATVAMLARV